MTEYLYAQLMDMALSKLDPDGDAAVFRLFVDTETGKVIDFGIALPAAAPKGAFVMASFFEWEGRDDFFPAISRGLVGVAGQLYSYRKSRGLL